MSVEEAYVTLSLSSAATPSEVKKAYRRFAMLYHPDRNSSSDAEEKFKKIKQAYEILNGKSSSSQFTDTTMDPQFELVAKFRDIVDLFALSSMIHRGILRENDLVLIQTTYDRMSKILESYFNRLNLDNQNTSSKVAGQLSVYNEFTLEHTLIELQKLAVNFSLGIPFFDFMVSRTVDWHNFNPKSFESADNLLSEYVKTINSEQRLSAFFDDQVFGTRRSFSWDKRLIDERDGIALYAKTLQEVLIGPANKHLADKTLNMLRVYIFNKENIYKHHSLLRNLLILAGNKKLNSLVLENLIISNTPNVRYQIAVENIDLVYELLKTGVPDEYKLNFFIEISIKNDTIFKAHPKIHNLLGKISDYSSLAKRTDLFGLSGWSDKNPYIQKFMSDFIKSNPPVAAEILEWNHLIQTTFLKTRIFRDEDTKKEHEARVMALYRYLQIAKRISEGRTISESHFKDLGIETYWDILIAKGVIKNRARSCKSVLL